MVAIGYKLMAEEHGPVELIRNARRAEDAGFEFAAISDHYFPWLPEEGHAPFAWSVLGGLAQATKRLGLMTAVSCPTLRYHPAIIAQATATLGVMSDNRFTLGLGAGERLNEHVVGVGWPGLTERHERLAEALAGVSLQTPRGQVFSNVDAQPHSDPKEIRTLLVRQVVSPVLWEDSVRNMLAAGADRFCEIGPGKVLKGLLKRIDRKVDCQSVGES